MGKLSKSLCVTALSTFLAGSLMAQCGPYGCGQQGASAYYNQNQAQPSNAQNYGYSQQDYSQYSNPQQAQGQYMTGQHMHGYTQYNQMQNQPAQGQYSNYNQGQNQPMQGHFGQTPAQGQNIQQGSFAQPQTSYAPQGWHYKGGKGDVAEQEHPGYTYQPEEHPVTDSNGKPIVVRPGQQGTMPAPASTPNTTDSTSSSKKWW